MKDRLKSDLTKSECVAIHKVTKLKVELQRSLISVKIVLPT